MSSYFISALRNEIKGPGRYYANSKDGAGASISYSFMTAVEPGTNSYYGDPNNGFEKYTSSEKAYVRAMLEVYESLINVHFTETSGASAEINFGQFNLAGNWQGYSTGLVYDPAAGALQTGPNHGDIFLDPKLADGFTILHEIGHTLGLKHPFEGAHRLSKSEDTNDFTVMSYTSGKIEAVNLRLYDVVALQSIYGPAHQRMGNNTYEFGKTKLIWDGGGTDTITAKSSATAVTINLNDGSWNYIGKKAAHLSDPGQVYIGDYTFIENVQGSSKNDRLTGNSLANAMSGGAGNDIIRGGAGADRLNGGTGNDTFVFAKITDSKAGSMDVIYDFTAGDRLDLHLIDASATASGNSAFKFIGTAGFHGHAGELRYSKLASDTYIYVDVDGDKVADLRIRLDDPVKLTSHSFLL